MNKKEFVERVTENLKSQGIKREIRFPSHTIDVYDITGAPKKVKFRGEVKEMYYAVEDVKKILDMVLDTVVDEIRDGGDVSLFGFGKFYSKMHKARRSLNPLGTEWYDVPAFRVPKFQYGKNLRLAAKSVELVQKDEEEAIKLMPQIDEDD